MNFIKKIGTFNAIFVLLTSFSLIPIWAYSSLPFVDYPQHLGVAHIFNKVLDPAAPYGDHFLIRIFPSAHILHTLLISLFSKAVPLEAAGKIFLSLYAVLLPVSVRMMIRALGGNRWASIAAFLVIYNYNLMWGFIGYCFGVALFFVTFSLMLRGFIDGEEKLLPAIPVLMFLVSLSQPQVYTLLLGACFCVLAVAYWGHPARAALEGALVSLPSLVWAAPWWYLLWSERGQRLAAEHKAWIPSPGILKEKAGLFISNLSPHLQYSDLLLILLLALCAALFVVSVRQEQFRNRKFIATCLVTCIALFIYFVAPKTSVGYYHVYPRYALFVAVCAIALCSTARIPGGRLVLVFVGATWLTLYAEILSAFAQFEGMTRPAREMIAKMEKNKVCVELYYADTIPQPVSFPAHRDIACYYQIEKDGLAGFIWPMDNNWHIVHLTKNYVSRIIRPQRASESIFPEGWEEFDYFLICGRPPRYEDRYLKKLEFVEQKGIWTLLKNKDRHRGG